MLQYFVHLRVSLSSYRPVLSSLRKLQSSASLLSAADYFQFRQSHRGYHRSRTRFFQGLLELLNSAGRRTLQSQF